jgi:hypothetical protein
MTAAGTPGIGGAAGGAEEVAIVVGMVPAADGIAPIPGIPAIAPADAGIATLVGMLIPGIAIPIDMSIIGPLSVTYPARHGRKRVIASNVRRVDEHVCRLAYIPQEIGTRGVFPSRHRCMGARYPG